MADKADLWMPLYIGDYLRDTRFLTLDEHGAYLLLLMEYWVSGPLPDEDRRLARLVGCSEQSWGMLRASLEQFFEINGGVWRHKRADKERAKAGNLKEARKCKAKAAAEARWGRRDDAQEGAEGNASDDAPSIAPSYPPSPSQSHTVEEDDGAARALELSNAAQSDKAVDPIALTAAICRAGGVRHVSPNAIIANQQIVREWLAYGASEQDMRSAVADELESDPAPTGSLRRFDQRIRTAVARRENRSNGTASPRHDAPRRHSRSDEIDEASRALGLS